MVENRLRFLDQYPRFLATVMMVIFLLAGALRLYKINAPGILVERDFTSAILARDFYFEHTNSVEAWRKEIAHITRQNQPILEPPVTEFLVSLLFRSFNSEQLWLARLLTSSFWVIGGIFLYKTAKIMGSTGAAVFATVYYLFVPMGVLLSRSFQPDSLMMMLFLISIFSIVKYQEKQSDLWLVTAATISGLTLLCRPLVFFTIFGTFTAPAIYQRGILKGILNRQYAIFCALALLPPALYYGFGIFVGGYLLWKVETSFRPQLMLHREFWKGWLDLAVIAVGHTALIGALIGIPMMRTVLSRAQVIGLGIGYMVFGLVFTMHIHTHGYYHAQLIPFIAISFGPVITMVADRIISTANKWYWWLPVIGAMLLVILFSLREVRSGLARNSYVLESVNTAREIGELVNHSSRTVWIAHHYGVPLQYYGELSGSYWPRKITYWLYRRSDERELSIEERLNDLGFSPEYFVITSFDEFEQHHTDLKEYLVSNCSLVAQSDYYLIYGFCAK